MKKGETQMSKEKFIRIQRNRGYKVTEFGLMIMLEKGDYSSIWFFNSDGTVDTTQHPVWKLRRG